MIKIAVCDDEAAMCRQIGQMTAQILTRWDEPFTIDCYQDPRSLLAEADLLDLLFLDIQMPGLDGVDLAKKLREQENPCAIIFVTILRDCMLDAFEVEAVDYLCKPVDKDRLERALGRVLKHQKEKNASEKSLFIQTKGWSRSVKICDIYYCEVINRKIYLHTKDGVVGYYGKLKEVAAQLDGHLIKCHRSYLVNPRYLQEYKNGRITLENGEDLPVSRYYQQALLEGIRQYLHG